MLKDYYALAKPGIIMGNLIATASGFFLASKGNIDFTLLLYVLAGTALVIASGCVFNNYIDRDIDVKMERTKRRVLVLGKVSNTAALVYAAVLGVLGFGALALLTNHVALLFAALGFVVYVVTYSLYYKRSSVHGTLIGSLSGACPPVIGYVTVSGQFDAAGAILLIVYCLWQIPHSYAIAIYRFDDYKAANIPVLPVKQGIKAAQVHMIGYIIGFAVAAMLLAERGYAGNLYALVIGLMSLYWLYLAKVGYQKDQESAWGKKLFIFSILMIVSFSVLISVDYVSEPLHTPMAMLH
ncbi:MAG: protoheme IX farnesyltransferase [Gammaproteobacteria bacterium]|nr:MAG: protoheme IX farnesyltransferase [Gammaproteobacteria bacterium]